MGLSIGRLENDSLGIGLEGYTELEKLGDDGGEVLKEEVVILSVLLNPWLHGLVLDESIVGGQHHQALSLVLVLLGAVPLSDVPLLIEE
ncbi:hypothetical protein O1611_g9457 [Lasiodiplodia mahajangana]|uniref:Uncharacterized protein n=1 Tax=Lasiodiplodia mahajangana TaxID=1108764 RepID=A0ACC2J9K2_9PEZI|nr:hypothetical protein O1611_g9457 [Lasiodiplodia mahajangana]